MDMSHGDEGAMDKFVKDFRRRENKLEDELKSKDKLIKQLKEDKMKSTKTRGFGLNGKTDEDNNNNYVSFLEKRLEETLEENKRYHSKYVEMREFAYTSVESLMR